MQMHALFTLFLECTALVLVSAVWARGRLINLKGLIRPLDRLINLLILIRRPSTLTSIFLRTINNQTVPHCAVSEMLIMIITAINSSCLSPRLYLVSSVYGFVIQLQLFVVELDYVLAWFSQWLFRSVFLAVVTTNKFVVLFRLHSRPFDLFCQLL